MPYKISNQLLEISIDLPAENYQAARFDWTGKIAEVSFRGVHLTTEEQLHSKMPNTLGRGFYNEFGIETAIGFAEAKTGEWFHKIGVGLLKKTSDHYLFHHPYEIDPCAFSVIKQDQKITIHCKSALANGYAYELQKEIELFESGFLVKYELLNCGQKRITTDEYSHNFLSIGNNFVGRQDILKFSFPLNPEHFNEYLNPKDVVRFNEQEITFSIAPSTPFFFSEICNEHALTKSWKLENNEHKIGLLETTSFLASKVNLWGCTHVISPELFVKIDVAPGETQSWWRKYEVYDLD